MVTVRSMYSTRPRGFESLQKNYPSQKVLKYYYQKNTNLLWWEEWAVVTIGLNNLVSSWRICLRLLCCFSGECSENWWQVVFSSISDSDPRLSYSSLSDLEPFDFFLPDLMYWSEYYKTKKSRYLKTKAFQAYTSSTPDSQRKDETSLFALTFSRSGRWNVAYGWMSSACSTDKTTHF